MRKYLSFFLMSLLVVGLTLLTQVGGVVWLLSFGAFHFLQRLWQTDIWQHRWVRWVAHSTIFLTFYSVVTFWLVPVVAQSWFGKVKLPDMGENPHLRPANSLTAWLNRNYVLPELRDLALKTSEEFGQTFAGATVTYLEGSFPFGAYAMLPHLTHRGKQLDIAFCYTDAKTGRPVNDIPSTSGYGVFEAPKIGETNTCDFCKKENSKYDVAKYFTFGSHSDDLKFDAARTRSLCVLFIKKNTIGKVLIEPHLEQRLGLASFGKVRFHGCLAVRHDDHFHIEIY